MKKGFEASAKKSVTLEKAFIIFDAQADRNDIAFGYLRDGCYARTHLMCRAFQDMGLSPKKAWVYETAAELYAELPDGRYMHCDWHVAPVLSVQMPDGKVEDLVFDPGLFDGPVTFLQWREHFSAGETKSEIAPFGVCPRNSTGDYTPGEKTDNETDRVSAEVMADYIKEQGSAPRIVFQTELRQKMAASIPVLSSAGKTWSAQPMRQKNAPVPVQDEDFQNPEMWGAGGCI
jgi:hypothetical protein